MTLLSADPLPPLSAIANDVLQTSAVVEWINSATRTYAEKYIVKTAQTGTDVWTEQADITEMTLSLTGLTDQTSYTVKVFSVGHSAMKSLTAATVEFTTGKLLIHSTNFFKNVQV